jgi:transposase
MRIAERTQNERLRQIILQRHRFGRRAETLPEDQMLLGFEDVEQVEASGDAKVDAANPAERAHRSTKRRVNRGSLPAHVPRIETMVDIDDHACPCCGSALHRNGKDTRCWSSAAPNMPAGPAKTERKLRCYGGEAAGRNSD